MFTFMLNRFVDATNYTSTRLVDDEDDHDDKDIVGTKQAAAAAVGSSLNTTTTSTCNNAKMNGALSTDVGELLRYQTDGTADEEPRVAGLKTGCEDSVSDGAAGAALDIDVDD